MEGGGGRAGQAPVRLPVALRPPRPSPPPPNPPFPSSIRSRRLPSPLPCRHHSSASRHRVNFRPDCDALLPFVPFALPLSLSLRLLPSHTRRAPRPPARAQPSRRACAWLVHPAGGIVRPTAPPFLPLVPGHAGCPLCSGLCPSPPYAFPPQPPLSCVWGPGAAAGGRRPTPPAPGTHASNCPPVHPHPVPTWALPPTDRSSTPLPSRRWHLVA